MFRVRRARAPPLALSVAGFVRRHMLNRVRDLYGRDDRSPERLDRLERLMVVADDGDDVVGDGPVLAYPRAEFGVVGSPDGMFGGEKLGGCLPVEVVDVLEELRGLVEEHEPADVVEEARQVGVFGTDAFGVGYFGDGPTGGGDLDCVEPQFRLRGSGRDKHACDCHRGDELADVVRAEACDRGVERFNR